MVINALSQDLIKMCFLVTMYEDVKNEAQLKKSGSPVRKKCSNIDFVVYSKFYCDVSVLVLAK